MTASFFDLLRPCKELAKRERDGERKRKGDEEEEEQMREVQHTSKMIFDKAKATRTNQPATQRTVLLRHFGVSERHLTISSSKHRPHFIPSVTNFAQETLKQNMFVHDATNSPKRESSQGPCILAIRAYRELIERVIIVIAIEKTEG